MPVTAGGWRWCWTGLLAVAALLVIVRQAEAREYEVDLSIEGLEELYELQQSGDLEADSVEVLEALYQRPMNVNRADRYLLYDLPGVTYELADAIVAYRSEHGPFKAAHDLLNIEGLTPQLLASMEPFITVEAETELPVVSTAEMTGETELGSIWRKGFGREEDDIDQRIERERGPQAFLRMRTTGFTYLGFGGLATYRRRTDAYWDYSRGYLVSEGPADVPDLDNIYLYGGYGGWSIILGSYTAGFGERLTFDSSAKQQPNGWYENDTVRQDNETGSVSPRPGQFGAAAALSGADFGNGWVDAAVFTSWVREDLYQYDFNYGLDNWYGANYCETDGNCPADYTCGDDHRCRCTRVYDADDPRAPTYRYETFRDAFDERLMGGNLTFNFDERSHVGVTGYYALYDFNLAEGAQPKFAYGSRYPRGKGSIGTFGVDSRWGVGPFDFGGEFARTSSGGNGVYIRGVLEPISRVELTLSGRYYDPKFDNPHNRGRSAGDELFGLSARNEAGGRFDATIRPLPRTRLVTRLDIWGNPYLPVFGDDGSLSYERKKEVPVDMEIAQRVTYGFTSKEEASLLAQLNNKDVRHNSRTEVYQLGDWCDEGVSDSNCGRGERRKLQARLSTKRVRNLNMWASYTVAWEDVSKFDTKFDLEQRIRLHGRWDGWPGGRLTLHVGFWLHQKEFSGVGNPDDPISDRAEPRIDTYAELRQRFGDHFTVWARYGFLHYRDEREERYGNYHLGKLILEARF